MLNILAQLKADVEVYYELLKDAERNNDVALEMQLMAELLEMKDMITHIEQPELHRHLRVIATNQWREFHAVK